MALPQPNKESDSIVVVKGLTKHFSVGRGLFRREQARLHAVDDVSFDVARGEVFGLVGESGCGKTTTGRMLVKLTVPTSGDIFVDNEDISAISGQGMR
ncbi:MAG TPA: ABC transporter ATP-binding protein, partial [Bacillota bacterium]|nr:ABC transporter ATP-binding protein [Bacillota bacterium]